MGTPVRKSLLQELVHGAGQIVGVSIWVTSVLLVVTSSLVIAIRFCLYGPTDPVAGILLLLQVISVILPLGTPTWAADFIKFASGAGATYFPIIVKVEDDEALKAGRPYLLGCEPHSALPVASVIAAAPGSTLLPKALRNCHLLSSSVCFWVPLVRHLWWWLGVRPVSKESMTQLLKAGKTLLLCPGGVQEVLYMQQGMEVALLKRRRGFVRLAMQLGVPIVPCFAFGQTDTYSWWRPGPPIVPQKLVDMYSRTIGYVPLLLWGRWGSTIPHRRRMTIVIGRPIEMPQMDDPPVEQVDKYLAQFIADMSSMFDRHKAECGYPSMELRIM